MHEVHDVNETNAMKGHPTVRIGFVGSGAMASAIARGIHANAPTGSSIVLYDRYPQAAQAVADSVGGTVAADLAQVVAQSDLVVLAVKPHIQKEVLAQLAPLLSADGPALISIAAGRSIAAIEDDLAEAGAQSVPPIVRVMPNVAAQVGQSASAVAYSPGTPQAVREGVAQVFDAVGTCLELNEDDFATFTAMASSSPAWFFEIAESLSRGGVKHGLTKADALAAVTQAMLGSALLLQQGAQDGKSPSQLVDQVSSPGGTTIAGLLAAQDAGLQSALIQAVDATVERFNQLDG